jgi:hypothetical protein
MLVPENCRKIIPMKYRSAGGSVYNGPPRIGKDRALRLGPNGMSGVEEE